MLLLRSCLFISILVWHPVFVGCQTNTKSIGIRPVIGLKVFNPWADATLIYPIYRGSLSISPTYGAEKKFNSSSFGAEFRQSHFISLDANNMITSDILVYRRATSLGGFYEFKNGLRIGIGGTSHFISDGASSLGMWPNREWGISEAFSFPFEGLRIEIRHEPFYRNELILDGDKFSLNIVYQFSTRRSDSTIVRNKKRHLMLLFGFRCGLNRHHINRGDGYNFTSTSGEWGLRYNIPNTKINIDARNSFWFSLSGGFTSSSINGKSNLVSLGLLYDCFPDKLLNIGVEHFWLTDHTFTLLFPYNKVDFYPERGVGIYADIHLTNHLMIEVRQQYAYHINSQLANIVKPSDIYRFSVGLYYTLHP